jgi:hypothetical protein
LPPHETDASSKNKSVRGWINAPCPICLCARNWRRPKPKPRSVSFLLTPLARVRLRPDASLCSSWLIVTEKKYPDHHSRSERKFMKFLFTFMFFSFWCQFLVNLTHHPTHRASAGRRACPNDPRRAVPSVHPGYARRRWASNVAQRRKCAPARAKENRCFAS